MNNRIEWRIQHKVLFLLIFKRFQRVIIYLMLITYISNFPLLTPNER